MIEWKILGNKENSSNKEDILTFLNNRLDRPHYIIDTLNIIQIIHNDIYTFILYQNNLHIYKENEFYKNVSLHKIIQPQENHNNIIPILTNYCHITFLFIPSILPNKDIKITFYNILENKVDSSVIIETFSNKIYSIYMYNNWIDNKSNLYIQLGIHIKPIYAYISVRITSFFYNYRLQNFNYTFSHIWTSDKHNYISYKSPILFFPLEKSSLKYFFGTTYYDSIDVTKLKYSYPNLYSITNKVISKDNHVIYHYQLSGSDIFVPTTYNIFENEHFFMYNTHKKKFLYITYYQVTELPVVLPENSHLQDIYIYKNICIILINENKNYYYLDDGENIPESKIYIYDISRDFYEIMSITNTHFFSNILYCYVDNNILNIYLNINYSIGTCGSIWYTSININQNTHSKRIIRIMK